MVVILKYEDVMMENTSEELFQSILEAYGPGGIGALAISGIPEFERKVSQFLPLAHDLVNLPEEDLLQLEDEASLFNAGWSFGKEKLGDKPDTSKGSFYFNPLCDVPGTAEDRERYPVAYPTNRWPQRIPAFEPSAKELGVAMHTMVCELARHVDHVVRRLNPDYELSLAGALTQTQKAKGRLLYYFPLEEEKVATTDGWIGWHNDSGFLTALCPDLFLNHETGEIIENPDPSGGLWVVNRDAEPMRVELPRGCLTVQVGECLQVVTGGALIATPHCVRPSQPPAGMKVSRISCPCFVDTSPDFPLNMPKGCTREQVLKNSVKSVVPPLGDRWTGDGQVFGDFLRTTFEKYYEAAKKAQQEG